MSDPLGTTIMALEQAIVDRLKAHITQVAVESYPDDPREYRLRHQRGALLVGYRGADYGGRLDVERVDQERTQSFDIVVLARGLARHGGAYEHLEAARFTLAGYVVPGFDPIVCLRERFLGHTDGVWSFAFTVSARTIATEIDDAALSGVLADLYS